MAKQNDMFIYEHLRSAKFALLFLCLLKETLKTEGNRITGDRSWDHNYPVYKQYDGANVNAGGHMTGGMWNGNQGAGGWPMGSWQSTHAPGSPDMPGKQEKLGKCFEKPNDNLKQIVRQCRCEVFNGDALQEKVKEIFENFQSKGNPESGNRQKDSWKGKRSLVPAQKLEKKFRIKRDDQRCSPKSQPNMCFEYRSQDLMQIINATTAVIEKLVGKMMVKKCFWDSLSLFKDGKVSYDKFADLFNNFGIDDKVKAAIRQKIKECVDNKKDTSFPMLPAVQKIFEILLPKEEIPTCFCVESAMQQICTDISSNLYQDIPDMLKNMANNQG